MEKLIEILSNADAPSGNEAALSRFITNEAVKYCDEVKKDRVGNIYAYKYAKSDKTIILCAHYDEVGFIVSAITDDGYLKFKAVGGIDESVLLAKRVRIGEICGVTGIKAVHLVPKDERDKKIKSEDMYIDIGVFTKEAAEKLVKVGDYGTFRTSFGKIGELVKGKAFDDRAGCAILLKLMKESYPVNVCFCFTVQEETGLRGASVASKNVNADMCIVVENTTCLDMPEVPDEKVSTRVGDGPALTIVDGASYPDKKLRCALFECMEKAQYKNVKAGGNDAGAFSRSNIKTAAVSVPSRYIHSPVSVASLNDMSICADGITKFLKEGAILD